MQPLAIYALVSGVVMVLGVSATLLLAALLCALVGAAAATRQRHGSGQT